MNFMKYVFYYFLIIHLFACYWNFVITDLERINFYQEENWEPFDYTNGDKLEKWYREEWIPPTNAIWYPEVQILKNEW